MNLTPHTIYRLLELNDKGAIVLLCEDWLSMFERLHDEGLVDDLDGADELKTPEPEPNPEPNPGLHRDWKVKNPLREVPILDQIDRLVKQGLVFSPDVPL